MNAFLARPWEASEGGRAELLAWFLDADFESDADFDQLIELTGRRVRVLRSHRDGRTDRIPPGTETGSSKVPAAAPRATFVRIYRDLQLDLAQARSYWQRAKIEGNREQRRDLADLALYEFHQHRADVTSLEVQRDAKTGDVIWPTKEEPPKPARRASSLAGELAMALYDELMSARSAGLCSVCHRPWLSPVRKRRRLCGRDECARKWRNDHRKPEDPAVVYERVKRKRERDAKHGRRA